MFYCQFLLNLKLTYWSKKRVCNDNNLFFGACWHIGVLLKDQQFLVQISKQTTTYNMFYENQNNFRSVMTLIQHYVYKLVHTNGHRICKMYSLTKIFSVSWFKVDSLTPILKKGYLLLFHFIGIWKPSFVSTHNHEYYTNSLWLVHQ